MLNFISFQEMYFTNQFDPEFEITPNPKLKNAPLLVKPNTLSVFPESGKPLQGADLSRFIEETTSEIAHILGLKKKK